MDRDRVAGAIRQAMLATLSAAFPGGGVPYLTQWDQILEDATRTAMGEGCKQCGEEPRGADPLLSNGWCFFCGYLSVPPGEERERIRAARLAKQGP